MAGWLAGAVHGAIGFGCDGATGFSRAGNPTEVWRLAQGWVGEMANDAGCGFGSQSTGT